MINSTTSNQQNLDLSNINFDLYGQNPQHSLILNKNSLFGTELKDYLNSLDINKITEDNKIKLIFQFEEGVSKNQRINIIDSLFENYKIINNLDIVSALYCEVNIIELIEIESDTAQFFQVLSINKPRLFSQPVFTKETLKGSNLNENSYPNWWISAIGADNLDYDGSGVNVTVLDSGVYNHLDLNIINRDSFVDDETSSTDYNGHGTHVAGIIGSNGASSGGKYRGVAPGVNIINAKAGNVSGGLSEIDIFEAIQWAAPKSDIISMSFGGSIFDESEIISSAITNAKNNHGVIFVASAGNSGPDYYTGGIPASHPDVISVGATNEDNELASFSSWGPSLTYLGYPDLVAPGVHIISTSAVNSVIEKEKRYIGDFFDFSGSADYIPLSGTSMSCPVVSGAIAILKEAYPSLTAETVRVALMEGARSPSDAEEEEDFLRSGAGLINVSASLDFLSHINSTFSDINNVSRIFPDILPVKPFNLLNFPGDSHALNLSIISGMNNNVLLEIPEIDGLSISLDKTAFSFTENDIDYTTINITVQDDATPGIRNFQINLTINGVLMDTADVSIEVRLPESRILMDSYHGLNDWVYPQFSFTQIGFYDAMKDLVRLNYSIDYLMEYWQPYYNNETDNYILTEERLAQYDLLVLQTPILPYSPEEINNIVNYYNSGGNILYLGTRYQEICSESLNILFSELNIDTQIQEENIMLDEWLGIGTSVTSLPVSPVSHELMEGVDKYYWLYGHSFDLTGSAEPIGKINNITVGVAYNGTQGKGNFIGFGDLHWLYNDYDLEFNNYSSNHEILLSNMMDYFLDDKEVSINIRLNTTRAPSSDFSISVYVKNLTTNLPIDNNTLASSLSAYITNGSNYFPIELTSLEAGIAFNNAINFPFTPRNQPYPIIVNFTKGVNTYNKSSKLLYYGSNSIPGIDYLLSNPDEVNKGSNIDLEVDLDSSSYDPFKAYVSLFSYSFYNKEKTVNRTIELSHSGSTGSTIYDNTLTLPTDPSGYGIFYIIPYENGYFTPNSPRQVFEINNYNPDIDESTSRFKIGMNPWKTFSETTQDDSVIAQMGSQGASVNFEIDAFDTGTINRDLDSQLTVSVNFFMAALSEPIGESQIIYPMISSSFYISVMDFDPTSQKFTGSLTIPNSLSYSSIQGQKSVSTAASAQQRNYISLLLVNVLDSEGNITNDPFIIILFIRPSIDWATIIIIIAVIAAIIGIGVFIYIRRRKKIEPEEAGRDYYQPYDTSFEDQRSEESYYDSSRPVELGDVYYCPFCGTQIDSPKKFCPSCGKELSFKD
ncbi:MAG: S8 family serine peptidase [Promethearchaeati archaeon]